MEQEKIQLSDAQKKFANRYRTLINGKDKLTADEVAVLQAECEKTAAMLPDYGIESLYADDTCVLCADHAAAHSTTCYATTDIGHADPKERDNNAEEIMGLRSGSTIPVTFSCCNRCKRNYRLCEYVPTAVGVLITIAALILLARRSIREWLMGFDMFIPTSIRPLIAFVLILIVAIYATVLLRNFMIKRMSKHTHLSVFELPLMRLLKLRGWFPLYSNRYESRLVFTNELPAYLHDKNSPDLAAITDADDARIEKLEHDAQNGDSADMTDIPEHLPEEISPDSECAGADADATESESQNSEQGSDTASTTGNDD